MGARSRPTGHRRLHVGFSSALTPFGSEGISTGPSLDHAAWFNRSAWMDEWVEHELTLRTVAGGRV